MDGQWGGGGMGKKSSGFQGHHTAQLFDILVTKACIFFAS